MLPLVHSLRWRPVGGGLISGWVTMWEKLVLYSLGNQAGPGIVVVNHASHLYNHCTLAEYQLIATCLWSFLLVLSFLGPQNTLCLTGPTLIVCSSTEMVTLLEFFTFCCHTYRRNSQPTTLGSLISHLYITLCIGLGTSHKNKRYKIDVFYLNSSICFFSCSFIGWCCYLLSCCICVLFVLFGKETSFKQGEMIF